MSHLASPLKAYWTILWNINVTWKRRPNAWPLSLMTTYYDLCFNSLQIVSLLVTFYWDLDLSTKWILYIIIWRCFKGDVNVKFSFYIVVVYRTFPDSDVCFLTGGYCILYFDIVFGRYWLILVFIKKNYIFHYDVSHDIQPQQCKEFPQMHSQETRTSKNCTWHLLITCNDENT